MKARLILVIAFVMSLLTYPAFAMAESTPSPGDVVDSSTSQTETIVLSRDQQPKANYPTLTKLAQDAEAKGIPLRQALDEYAKGVIANNPSAQHAMPDGPVPDPTIDVDGIPFAELIDLDHLAKSKNISFEEAIDRYAWTPKLRDFKSALNAKFHDQLAGVAIVDDGRGIRVGFKDGVPSEAVDLGKTLPVQVTFTGGKGFSEAELVETANSRYDALTAYPEVAEATAAHDNETGIVTLTVELRKNLAQQVAPDITLQPAPSNNPHIKVDLKVVDDLGIEPADNYLRGGGYLEKSGEKICTAGFNAISSSGVKNSTTARHCAQDQYQYLWYRNHPDYDTGGTTLGRIFRATKYDLARYQGGSLTRTRTFYYELNLPRYARAIDRNPSVGDPICSFGRTSAEAGLGARCGQITGFYDQSPAGPDSILVDYALKKGDSGGPGYWGSTAIAMTSEVAATYSVLTSVAGFSSDGDGLGSNWEVWICSSC